MHNDPDAPEAPLRTEPDTNAPHDAPPAPDADAGEAEGGEPDAPEQGGEPDAPEQGGEPDAPEQGGEPDAEEDVRAEGIEAQVERLPSDGSRRVVGVLLFLNGNASPALARAVLASADADAEDVAAALAAAQAEAPAGSAAHAVGPWEVPEGAGPVLLTGYHERLRGQDLILGAAGTPAEAFALWLAAHEASGERAHRINVDVVAWLPSAAELRAWLDATAAVARAEVVGRRRHALERSRWLGRAARNNDDRALVAAALNLAGAPEAERAEAAAAVKGRRAAALVASWEARLKASWGEAQPPPAAPAAPAPPAEAPTGGRPPRKPRRKPAKPSTKKPAKAR